MIEFAGTPKAGKTSALTQLSFFLKRSGFSVRVFQERASVAPITGKGTPAFNAWVTCATLLGVLEAMEDEKLDILILDRGLFDGLIWNDWQEATRRITPREAAAFRDFVLELRWWRLIDILFVMHCSPQQALQREYAGQLTLQPGSIMNLKTLRQLKGNVIKAVDRYRSRLRKVLTIDTSNLEPRQGVMRVAAKTLSELRGFLDEEVLCIPAAEFRRLGFDGGGLRIPSSWTSFRRLVNQTGRYVARSKAEVNDDWVQVVPVVVIRHAGTYLTNVRHEPNESLHETLAIWTGGHVRVQDLEGVHSRWESAISGLRREINEELLLANLPKPRPIALVHTKEDARAARHLGVVFQLELDDAQTAGALEGKTIAERPDKHVRTSWMKLGELRQRSKEQKEWSLAITEFLARR